MKKILLIILLAATLIPTASKADNIDTYTLIEPLPCIDTVTNPSDCVNGLQKKIDLNTYILYVYKFSIALAVFLAIIMIIWGGFLYITSEVPFIKSDGKAKIENAVWGLVMVLISYLILMTIDPRLVNIDSSIEPIKVNKEKLAAESRAFQNQLNSDLSSINEDNQIRIKALKTKTQELETERSDIDAQLQNEEITDAEAEKLYAKKDQEIKQTKATEVEVVAGNEGQVNFKRAQIAITDDDEDNLEKYTREKIPDNPNGTGESRYPINAPDENEIQSLYNQRIRQLLRDNPSSIVEVSNLNLQKDFYIEQVIEEKKLDTEIKDDGISIALVKINTGGKALKQKLQTYTSDMNDPVKLEVSGISSDEYKKIYQTRIDRINSILEPKP